MTPAGPDPADNLRTNDQKARPPLRRSGPWPATTW